MTNLTALTLVLAEDDPGHATLLERTLRRGGVRNGLRQFTDGEAALAFLRSPEVRGGRFLLLLDVRMPRLGGLEVLRELRGERDPALRALPALVLSTAERDEEAGLAQELGAPLLAKPVDLRAFLAAVETLGLRGELDLAPGGGSAGKPGAPVA